jgi:pimeloyl-ACP methyl ester carboxylesterase
VGLLKVNGAELYYEVRGAGPLVLLIMGATGDGGHFHGLVELLADEYTVVTYDRRGNGRSPRPRGWNTTSNDEQVDDAAALLRSIGLAPAVVFGTSLGAIYALDLLIRHPDAVRGAILHEPPLYGVLDDSEQVLAEVAPQLREAMETGGPPAPIGRAAGARSRQSVRCER